MDRVVHHSEMAVPGTRLEKVFVGQFLWQDLFDERSSTHCGGAGFTLSHHTPVNFAFKVNLWIIFAPFALLHFLIVNVFP